MNKDHIIDNEMDRFTDWLLASGRYREFVFDSCYEHELIRYFDDYAKLREHQLKELAISNAGDDWDARDFK